MAGLPQGDYDIPLGLTSKRYNPDGTLWSPEANGETTNLFGDVIHVNGQPWPYLKVEPRKYRFRFLDAAISRSFQLYFEQATKVGTRINFKVVGSDAGLLLNPVDTTQLDISMADAVAALFNLVPEVVKIFGDQNGGTPAETMVSLLISSKPLGYLNAGL